MPVKMLGPKYLVNGTIKYFAFFFFLAQGCYETITETSKDAINQDNIGPPAFSYYHLFVNPMKMTQVFMRYRKAEQLFSNRYRFLEGFLKSAENFRFWKRGEGQTVNEVSQQNGHDLSNFVQGHACYYADGCWV